MFPLFFKISSAEFFDPYFEASIKGVRPSLSFALIFADAFNNATTAKGLLYLAAKCKGVYSCKYKAITFAFSDMSKEISLVFPVIQA